ncbi:alkaline phosphatase family protein [Halopenitus persicus]|uniref:alkaline phosphatase family protein n=1 Tax=Halopenitus persicus TaxID=1048396 RepID=UPI000BBA84B7|nr:alkaline phosphatase family protein [Halopenitus persicus]
MGLIDRLRGTDDPRVVFLGIDGVPYRLIASEPETFPNLTAMIESGSAGSIESIYPPETTACWPAITTGSNPGETGVYGYQDREIGSYDTYVPMGRDVQHERIWDLVTEAGRDASVFNVPVTFPPQRTVQRMVSGFLAPDVDAAATPEELRSYLDSIDYLIDVNAKLGHRTDKSDFLDHARRTLDRRQKAFREYVERDDWDLFVGVYLTPDRINHFLFDQYVSGGPDREAFLAFYERLDECIGEIRTALDRDTTLVVASDHGFAPIDRVVNCNEWLERSDWLVFRDRDHDALADIDDDARAYSLGPGRFYLNLEGREPRGSVPQAEYEETRAELKRQLEELESPAGKPVVRRVVETETAFRGDHDEIAPDLVAIPHDGFDLKADFLGHEAVFEDPGPRTGMHSFDDAALLIDEPGVTIDDADILDIAPTLLQLLDVSFQRTAFDGASLVQ